MEILAQVHIIIHIVYYTINIKSNWEKEKLVLFKLVNSFLLGIKFIPIYTINAAFALFSGDLPKIGKSSHKILNLPEMYVLRNQSAAIGCKTNSDITKID